MADQPQRIKAIETRYAGCRFRSRLEARWAVFFDTLGIRWEYEPQGFDFPDMSGIFGNDSLFTGRVMYLPDFWLPENEVWVEVKGPKPTEDDCRKVMRLGHEVGRLGQRVRMLVGPVPEAPAPLMGMWSIASSLAVIHGAQAVVEDRVAPLGDDRRNGYMYGKAPVRSMAELAKTNPGGWPCTLTPAPWVPGCSEEELRAALAAARSARFEHGQHG